MDITFIYNGNQYRGANPDIRTEIYTNDPLKMAIRTGYMLCWNETQNTAAFVSIYGILDKANRTDNTKTYWQLKINGTNWKPTDLEALQLEIGLEF